MMGLQVLVIQPDSEATEFLVDFFREQEDQVWQATTLTEAYSILEQHEPDLLLVDLHQLGDDWKDLQLYIRQKFPRAKTLFTISYPDPEQEIQARKQYGVRVFLRQPFTRAGIEQALRSLEGDSPIQTGTKLQTTIPKVRVPVRTKITIPYVVLALILTLAAAYVVSRVVLDTLEERFTNQLIEAGKMTSDWMVNEEDRLLETLRLLSYTQGVPEAVRTKDAERLREIALPLAINYREEAIEILDSQATSVLSLYHRRGGNIEDYAASRGETIFGQWSFVQNVLEQRVDQGRDKYAGLAQAPRGVYFYVSGPILDDQGDLVGVILVGKSLLTLSRQIRQDTLAHTTLYDFNGQAIASTLLLSSEDDTVSLDQEVVLEILRRQDDSSLIRPLKVASINYREIVGPWEVREISGSLATSRRNNDIGLIGVSLAETFLTHPGQITRLQIIGLTIVAFLLVIALGVYLANRITYPLLHVAVASAKVAQGDLDVQVESTGDDEVAVLAHSFNQMVSGLREGSIYRDLLGRTVSPEIREQLRQGLASGDVSLQGQEAVATVLMSDICGFTTLSESENPTTILGWLNEYFEELVPIITDHGGVISGFAGDAVLAFFGILPHPLSAQESACRACQTALAMLGAIERLNIRRTKRGEPILRAGIGVNTGPVTAGALGSWDRMHYTIIGDTVNATARLENLTRKFGEGNSAVISQYTLLALGERRYEFELEPLGAHTVKGKVEQLIVYRLRSAESTA